MIEVLMDIHVRKGWHLKAMSKQEHCKETPIIAVTAKTMLGDRAKCIGAGALDYISKPMTRANWPHCPGYG